MKAKILWIQGKRAEGPSFISGLRKKGYVVETAANGNEALARLPLLNPDLVVLDAASLRTSGKRICRSLRKLADNLPIVMITDAERPVEGELCANAVLMLPFTLRKLINRIGSLLPGDGNGNNLIQSGPLSLDLERKQVRCRDHDVPLTPRLAQLLQILMEHHGEVLERQRLFREVWQTDYTADTRTLDVHISWLREAIEEDPRNPALLKTVRGVGYRLDV